MITVQNTIEASLETVWEVWTNPSHVMKWNHASEDWHTTYAENDLRVGGKFKYTMAAKDKSMSFDFEGEYTKLEPFSRIDYVLGDGRKIEVSFQKTAAGVRIIEMFDPETENTESLQKQGWQSILDNFKKYAEQV